MMRCSLALALAGSALSDVLDSLRPHVDIGQVSSRSCPKATLSSLLLAHFSTLSTQAAESVHARRITQYIHMASQEDKSIPELALDALGTTAKLQITKARLPLLRELSENKKTIKEADTMGEASRSEARELRKQKQAADTLVVPVDLGGKGIAELALDALGTSAKLQIMEVQLPLLRELSENKKTIKDSKTIEEARRSEARELRKEKQAADTFVETVDFDSNLIIDTAQTLVELQKARIELFTERQLRSLQEGVDAVVAGPKQLFAEAQAKVAEATTPKQEEIQE
jgi:hypothetical protein